MSPRLDPSRIPASGLAILGLADRWGIGDDFDREAAVDGASTIELGQLVEAVDGLSDEFWAWLAGPESFAQPPSAEYVALTNVTMAADSARLRLQRSLDIPAR